jgi:hypothetical protein
MAILVRRVENSSVSNEKQGLMEEEAPPEHRIAIHNFDGTNQVVEADELRVCVPTKECLKFWATLVACFIAMAIGIFFMLYDGTESDYFPIGEALLVLGAGVLIPGPDFASMRHTPAATHSDAEPERTPHRQRSNDREESYVESEEDR